MADPLSFVERRIGFVYSEEGVYEPDEITFTVEERARVEIGDIVCIKHPSKDTLVFYQVVEVPVRRKARDYEEDLARIGQPLLDDTRNYPRARAKQVGYVEDPEKLMKGEAGTDDLLMLIEHIKPLCEVYAPKPEAIDRLLQPEGDSVVVGRVYPNWKHEYRFNLQRLLRQGLLVVGGIGTGKTTTLLNIVYRTVKAVLERGGKPRVLIVDKDGEYGVEELKELVGEGGYLRVRVEDIGGIEHLEKDAFAERLLKELGFTDKRSKAARAVYDAAFGLEEEVYRLEPRFFKEKILPVVKQKYPDVLSEVTSRLARWEASFQGAGRVYNIGQLVGFLRRGTAIIHLDLSTTRDYDRALSVVNSALRIIYNTALEDFTFGCIVVVDEAHLYAPERGGIQIASDEIVGRLRDTLHLIATTGPRNGITPFLATQRPSLITKTITTQMGQNIIAHRVEDVDLERIEEIVGPVARRVRVLPRGWAIVKGLAAKVREPMIVMVEAEIFPKSHGRTTYERFLSGAS